MSRLGKNPVAISKGVTVTVAGGTVSVQGPLGDATLSLPAKTQASVDGAQVLVSRTGDTREARSMHGLARNLIANMIEGVSKGYSKVLQIEGVGFKASVQGKKLSLSLGFASPVLFDIPAGVKILDEAGVKLTISGVDKQQIGDTAARIRSYFPAEPYKGKGIRYAGEHVKRKVGKTVA